MAREPMKLKTLFASLAEKNQESLLLFSSDIPVDSIVSYRGNYSDAALTWGKEPQTVAEFLAKAREVMKQKTLSGYKGGEFPITGETLTYSAEDYGHYSEEAVVGVCVRFGKVILEVEETRD